MDCPDCGKQEHFYVHPRKRLYHCFVCGLGGKMPHDSRLKEYVMVLRTMRLWEPESRSQTFQPDEAHGAPLIPDDAETAVSWLKHDVRHLGRRAAIEYLLGRGLTLDQIRRHKVYTKPLDPRVYFPVWEEDGSILYYCGRATSDDVKPKTLEPAGADKPLFGRHLGRQDDDGEVVLVEGIFDYFVTPHSYALMGSSVSRTQAMQLKSDGVDTVYLILDPDARDKSRREAQKLRKMGLIAHSVILEGTNEDPADLGEEIMRGLVYDVRVNAEAMQPELFVEMP